MKVYYSDLQALRRNSKDTYCARGSRAFFLSKGWDWWDFLNNGIDIEILKKVEDVMVKKVVEYVENGRK